MDHGKVEIEVANAFEQKSQVREKFFNEGNHESKVAISQSFTHVYMYFYANMHYIYIYLICSIISIYVYTSSNVSESLSIRKMDRYSIIFKQESWTKRTLKTHGLERTKQEGDSIKQNNFLHCRPLFTSHLAEGNCEVYHFFLHCLSSSKCRQTSIHLPSTELTYPTWGKGKSSSKVLFYGIC